MDSQSEISRVSIRASLVLVLLFAVSQLTAPYYEIHGLLGDLWVETDAIWRTSLGQHANSDFVTPLGPLFYGVYRVPLLFENASLTAMVHANILLGTAAALMAYGVSARSAPKEAVALLVTLAFFTAASGRALGTPLAAQSVPYIVPYNRWSWGIALPTAFALLMPQQRGARLPFLIAGGGFAALFYIKLSYFVGICGLALMSQLIDWDIEEGMERSRRAAWFGGAACLGLLAGAALSSPAQYLHDVSMIAAANYVGFRLIKFVIQLPEALIMFGLASVIYTLAAGGSLRSRRALLKLAALVFVACAIMVQNHENNESPLYFGALILAYALGRKDAPPSAEHDDKTQRITQVGFYLTLLLLLIPVGADAGTAMIDRLRSLGKRQPPITSFRGTLLSDFRSSDKEELAVVQNGLSLLARAGQQGRTVLSFTMGNPFPALTHTRSPRGAMAILWYGRTFSERHRPPAGKLLGDAEFLLFRKGEATSAWILHLYQASILQRYRIVADSPYWVLWRRV